MCCAGFVEVKRADGVLPMSFDDVVIEVNNLSKRYEMYSTPRDRLKQLLLPGLYQGMHRVSKFFGISSPGNHHQYFREFWALRRASFQVRRGETVGIVGLNGSGKSTLLQLICSTLTPTSGSVEVKGRVAALLELGSGFSPDYTGRENVFLNGQILGLSQKEIQAKYQEIVDFADIGDFIDQPVKTYSSGMAVRLAFAVAINSDPDVLVVDEALAVGDVGFQARCFARISEIKRRGVTLLFVSHSPSAITQLCDRAILLDRGELLLLGTPNQAIRAYNHLASAGPMSYADIRKEIVLLAQRENASFRSTQEEPEQIEYADALPEEKRVSTMDAYLDSALKDAVKPLAFDCRGAEISGIVIVDKSGKAVNVLPQQQRFLLKFNVRFETAIERVRFSWIVRTSSGLVLGGGSTHQPGSGIRIGTSGLIEVKSQFVNIFAPGDYLIDVGVRGSVESDDEFLHGVTNALTIRSVSYSVSYRNGLVDCLLHPAFELFDENGKVFLQDQSETNFAQQKNPKDGVHHD